MHYEVINQSINICTLFFFCTVQYRVTPHDRFHCQALNPTKPARKIDAAVYAYLPWERNPVAFSRNRVAIWEREGGKYGPILTATALLIDHHPPNVGL